VQSQTVTDYNPSKIFQIIFDKEEPRAKLWVAGGKTNYFGRRRRKGEV
jgi:predicted metalloprotease with PDZ domain